MNNRMGSSVGLNCATANSIASNRVKIKIRTLTSQLSQLRSSKLDCM